MLKVLIIDDEPSVLEGLKLLVNWEGLGLFICGEASDGKEGLNLIEKYRPDIVITDIRMPGYDGLELIEKASNKGFMSRYIILSGYGDFGYAKKAMMYGVEDYLLKPLEIDELERALDKLTADIWEEREKYTDGQEEIRHTVNYYFTRLINGEANDKDIEKLKFILEIGSETSFRIISIVIAKYYEKGIPADLGEKICDEVMKISQCKTENVFYNGYGGFILIVNENNSFFHKPKKLCEKINENIYNLLDRQTLFYVSRIGKGVSDIINMKEEISFLKQVYIYSPGAKIFIYDDLKEFKFSEEMLELPYDDIGKAVKSGEKNKTKKAVEHFFCILKSKKPSQKMLVLYMFRLGDMLESLSSFKNVNIFPEIASFVNNIYDTSVVELEEKAYFTCVAVQNAMEKQKGKSVGNLAGEIVSYISDNYNKEISLQLLADEFSLSPIVISKIIKTHTGKKFNDYINAVKIDNAKKMIAGTGLNISEISKAVGYKDYGYFTNKFRKETGVLPSEYKNTYR